MERGPYDRPPAGRPYPEGDPRYVPPPDYEPPPRRSFGVAEAVATVALIAGVIAIFLALDAREQGNDDEQLARQVSEEVDRKVRQIRTSVGQRAGAAGARARDAEAEAEQTREALNEMRTQLSGLREQVSSIQSRQNQMRANLERQSEAISSVRRAARE